jgi:hypothetical protein
MVADQIIDRNFFLFGSGLHRRLGFGWRTGSSILCACSRPCGSGCPGMRQRRVRIRQPGRLLPLAVAPHRHGLQRFGLDGCGCGLFSDGDLLHLSCGGGLFTPEERKPSRQPRSISLRRRPRRRTSFLNRRAVRPRVRNAPHRYRYFLPRAPDRPLK